MKTAALESGAKVHYAEHPHPIRRHGVFLLHDANLGVWAVFGKADSPIGCCSGLLTAWRCHDTLSVQPHFTITPNLSTT